MAAAKDAGIASAVTTANKFWEDQDLRARMEAREDYYRRVRTEQAKMRRLQEALAMSEEKRAEMEEKYRKEKEELQAELELLRRQLEEKKQTE